MKLKPYQFRTGRRHNDPSVKFHFSSADATSASPVVITSVPKIWIITFAKTKAMENQQSPVHVGHYFTADRQFSERVLSERSQTSSLLNTSMAVQV
jgi:hypothetical protein